MWRMRLVSICVLLACAACPGADSSSAHHTTRADIDRWMTELSNWGRWGKDDQVGTVYLITAAKRKEAAALVKDGVAFTLALDTLLE